VCSDDTDKNHVGYFSVDGRKIEIRVADGVDLSHGVAVLNKLNTPGLLTGVSLNSGLKIIEITGPAAGLGSGSFNASTGVLRGNAGGDGSILDLLNPVITVISMGMENKGIYLVFDSNNQVVRV
jgi:hypothetical protein